MMCDIIPTGMISLGVTVPVNSRVCESYPHYIMKIPYDVTFTVYLEVCEWSERDFELQRLQQQHWLVCS